MRAGRAAGAGGERSARGWLGPTRDALLPPLPRCRHSSFTLDVEARSDIARICVSPDGGLLVIIDVDGYALVVNLRR